MRVFFKEVVFDLPGVIDTELVSQLYLLKCLLEKFLLGALKPGLGQLMFVKDAKFHAASASNCW